MAQFIYTLEKARKAHGDKVVLDNVTLALPARSEDRRRRPERRRQVQPAADHGGRGPAEQRRGAADARLHRRHGGPGAEARRVADRAGEHRAGRRRHQGEAGPVQRDRRADGHRLLRRADGGDGPAAGGARPRRRLGPRLQARAGDGRAALPAAATPTVGPLSGGEKRRVALCKLLLEQPDLLLLDEPTNHLDAESVLWLEQHLAKYPGTVMAITHDRYFLDHVAEWILELDRGRTYPYEGNYSTYLEKKAERMHDAGPQGHQAAQAAGGRAGMGALERQGAPDQVQGPAGALRGDGRRGGEDPQAGLRGDPDPAGPAPGQPGDRVGGPAQGLRRPGAHRRPVVLAAAQRHRRRDRPERRRQDHAVQDDRRAGEGRLGRGPGRRHGRAVLRRPGPRRARPASSRSGRSSPTGSTT